MAWAIYPTGPLRNSRVFPQEMADYQIKRGSPFYITNFQMYSLDLHCNKHILEMQTVESFAEYDI